MSDGYYIYGIIDPTELSDENPSITDRLGATIYVGKGVHDRLNSHVKNARALMEYEAQTLLEEGVEELEEDAANDEPGLGRKLARLKELLESDIEPEVYKFVAGLSNEEEAYGVESFAIEAVNAIRSAMGRTPLTNAVKGHGVACEPLENYVDRMNVGVEALNFDSEYDSILVKANNRDMMQHHSALDPQAVELGNRLPADLREKISFMVTDETTGIRRGYDPAVPWSDTEARERCGKYWPISEDRVHEWLRNPEAAPKYLMGGVKLNGETIIRYVWELDWSKPIERFEDGKRWGLPLGEAMNDHPYLNKCLVDADTGAQVLHNYAAGIRIDRF